MKEQILEALKSVINPSTGKSLVQENRILEVEIDQKDLKIKYSREGINPSEKRELEDLVINKLKSHWNEENIYLLSNSKNSSDVIEGGYEKKEQANLKVGHGQLQPKKMIPGVKKVIAIASGKGGVGKSTVTVNTAIALTKLGLKVGILDADIYGPSVPMLLNSRNKKPLATPSGKIAPMNSCGIPFMSFGLFINEDDPVIWRGPMLGGVLNQFLFDVDWGDLDLIIIDMPPGTGDVQLSLVQATHLDGSIIVSTPQDVALLDARKGLMMFQKMNTPILGMIENMSSFICDSCDKEHFIFGTNGVKKATSELGQNYLGSIPLELELRVGSDNGEPFMSNESFKSKKSYSSYMSIAENIKGVLRL